ncbi:DUF4214 domain-containing protein [Cyanobacterium stanieri LEGE 03274]|uniref:DUF4214 domain-containing protein n=1 Tax=Cyanobacterium stanieri LEGE 03274 TaxID=1828756 RepID=A0ABR9V1W8_9CHRO|nr:DUF4214 domain-containing protein [Cyanobacterium stanieri LEGE 03274]
MASAGSVGGEATLTPPSNLSANRTYRLQIVGRQNNNDNNLFTFNTGNPVTYNVSAELSLTSVAEFQAGSFIPRTSGFSQRGAGANSVSLDGVLQGSDNFLVAFPTANLIGPSGFTTTNILTPNNLTNNISAVGYADEFKVDIVNSTQSSNGGDLVVTVNTRTTNGLGANDDTRPYISVVNDSTGEILPGGQVFTFLNNGSTSVTIPEGIIDTLVQDGDSIRIKVAGFEANGPNIAGLDGDANLPYSLVVSSVNRNITVSERLSQAPGVPSVPETPSVEPLTLNSDNVQIAYVAYYGRPADPEGRDFWSDVLARENVVYSPRSGSGIDTLSPEALNLYNTFTNDFGNVDSQPEALEVFGGLNAAGIVNRIYRNAFNRNAEAEGLAFWTGKLNEGFPQAAIALEIALGAQATDIVALNNKIEGADLFTDNLISQGVINRYNGETARQIGRNFVSSIDQFSIPSALQGQVDTAINSLPA